MTKNQIFNIINSKYYIPKLKDKLEILIGNCYYCKLGKADRQPLHKMGGGYDSVSMPRICWSMDLAHGMGSTKDKFTSLAVMVDQFSLYTILVPIRTKSAEELLEVFKTHIVSSFGLPAALRSDAEPSLTKSGTFLSYCQENNIHLLTTAPSSPFSNGLAERRLGQAKEMIRTTVLATNNPDWNQHLPAIQTALNNTKSIYGWSPQETMFGFESMSSDDILQFTQPESESPEEYMATLKSNLNKIHGAVHARREKKRQQNETTHNAARRTYNFAPDDVVNVRSHVVSSNTGLRCKYKGPYVVSEVSKTGQTAALSSLLENKVSKSHIQNLRHVKHLPTHSILNDGWDSELLAHQQRANHMLLTIYN